MSDRLTDDDVSRNLAIAKGLTKVALLDLREARTSLGVLRTLIKGGPCATCGGTRIDRYTDGDYIRERPCLNCNDWGCTPGIIERLEVAASYIEAPCTHPDHRPGRTRKGIREAIATLREAVES